MVTVRTVNAVLGGVSCPSLITSALQLLTRIELRHSPSMEQLPSPVAKVLCRLKLHKRDDYHGLLTLHASV